MHVLDDWKVDEYRWFQYGTKLIPRSGPVFRKIHFVIVLQHGYDKRFKRQTFFLLDAKQPWKAVLLHYLGDESIALDYPHGNAESDQIYHCTSPSVLTDLASPHDHPSIICKNAISTSGCPAECQPAFMPHNCWQIKAFRTGFVRKLGLHMVLFTTCTSWLMTLMALWKRTQLIRTLLSFVAMTESSVSFTWSFGQFLINLNYSCMTQPFRFVTSTFQHIFRHTLFSTSPVIPVLFLVHERKFEKMHEKYMECLAELVSGLVNRKCPVSLVTDKEVGINKVSNDSYMYKHF